jgi:hypothetical protein
MQKENLFFFSFPNESNFGEAKVRISERKAKFIWTFPNESNFGEAKVNE